MLGHDAVTCCVIAGNPFYKAESVAAVKCNSWLCLPQGLRPPLKFF